MKKHRLLAYVLAPVMGIGLLGSVGVASAQGFGYGMGMMNTSPEQAAMAQQQMFERQAALLGISVADIKVAWAVGKDLKTLATERGISPTTIQANREALQKTQMQAVLSTLVSKGIITQAQADSRLAYLVSAPKGKAGKGEKGGKGGMMEGMRGGMRHGGFGF